MALISTLNNSTLHWISSFMNIVVVVALIATGIDHWAMVPVNVYDYYFSASIALGFFSVICGLILFALEFQRLNNFFLAYTPFIMKPTGRGILYILLGILTSGIFWYQILSVIVVMVFGFLLIFMAYNLPDLILLGLIPAKPFGKGLESQPNTLTSPTATASQTNPIVYSLDNETSTPANPAVA